MAEDVESFLQENELKITTLIGHSMGAKTAMTVALRRRVPIANLIPVDNAPVDAALVADDNELGHLDSRCHGQLLGTAWSTCTPLRSAPRPALSSSHEI